MKIALLSVWMVKTGLYHKRSYFSDKAAPIFVVAMWDRTEEIGVLFAISIVGAENIQGKIIYAHKHVTLSPSQVCTCILFSNKFACVK